MAEKLIYCKNNRNWKSVQETLNSLPGPRAKVVVEEDGEPRLTANGLVVIEGTDFTEFSLKNQGYADVIDWDEFTAELIEAAESPGGKMKCNACNAAEDQGANQVFQCDSCKEMFVAVEQDHATQQVLEAAFKVAEWAAQGIKVGAYIAPMEVAELAAICEQHSDFKGKK